MVLWQCPSDGLSSEEEDEEELDSPAVELGDVTDELPVATIGPGDTPYKEAMSEADFPVSTKEL